MKVSYFGLDSSSICHTIILLKWWFFRRCHLPNPTSFTGQSGTSKGTTFLVWDIGGQDKLRPLWRSYTRCTDGIVFVVDSVDEERMEEARFELLRTVRIPENKGVPILVLANKQDLPGAKDPLEVAQILGLEDLTGSHLWHVQPACAIIGEGLDEGMEVLYDMILKRRKMAKQSKRKR